MPLGSGGPGSRVWYSASRWLSHSRPVKGCLSWPYRFGDPTPRSPVCSSRSRSRDKPNRPPIPPRFSSCPTARFRSAGSLSTRPHSFFRLARRRRARTSKFRSRITRSTRFRLTGSPSFRCNHELGICHPALRYDAVQSMRITGDTVQSALSRHRGVLQCGRLFVRGIRTRE
jgi:hypothetical protein